MNTKILVVALAFFAGYVFHDVVQETGLEVISSADAKVDGMDYKKLRKDRDFKKAVQYVVSRYCTVDNLSIAC